MFLLLFTSKSVQQFLHHVLSSMALACFGEMPLGPASLSWCLVHVWLSVSPGFQVSCLVCYLRIAIVAVFSWMDETVYRVEVCFAFFCVFFLLPLSSWPSLRLAKRRPNKYNKNHEKTLNGLFSVRPKKTKSPKQKQQHLVVFTEKALPNEPNPSRRPACFLIKGTSKAPQETIEGPGVPEKLHPWDEAQGMRRRGRGWPTWPTRPTRPTSCGKWQFVFLLKCCFPFFWGCFLHFCIVCSIFLSSIFPLKKWFRWALSYFGILAWGCFFVFLVLHCLMVIWVWKTGCSFLVVSSLFFCFLQFLIILDLLKKHQTHNP